MFIAPRKKYPHLKDKTVFSFLLIIRNKTLILKTFLYSFMCFVFFLIELKRAAEFPRKFVSFNL